MTGSDSVEGADDVITDDDVRSGYAEPSHGFGDEVERAYVKFDRWLLSHDLSVSADTLRDTADWLDRATDPDHAEWDPAIAGIEFDTDILRRRADALNAAGEWSEAHSDQATIIAQVVPLQPLVDLIEDAQPEPTDLGPGA